MPDSMDLIRAAHYGKNPPDESRRPMMPTIFERAGAAVADVPVLGSVLGKLGEVGQIGLKAASAVPLALQGDFDKVGERLKGAAMGVPQFFGVGGEPAYLDPGTVLDEMGLTGQGGRVDIPVLGTFTGRGLGKFLLSLGTDPLMYTGVGGLTKAGRIAKSTPGLRPAAGLAEAPVVAGRVGSRLASQVMAGQRGLLTFMGHRVPLMPKRMEAAALGGLERGFRKVASKSPLSRYGGFGELREAQSGAGLEGGMFRVAALRGGREVRQELEEMAAAKGVPVDDLAMTLAAETETIMNRPALRRQRLRLERTAARAQATHERMVAEAASEAPDVLKSQGGTMPVRARRALDVATRARAEAAEVAVPTVREATGMEAARAGTSATARGVPVRGALGDNLRATALRWADEYEAQGWPRREAVRAAYQRVLSPGLDSEMAPLAAMWDRVLRPLVREERRRGVMVESLSDPMLNWVKRSLTPEAQEALAASDPLSAVFRDRWQKRFSATHASAMKRKAAYEGMKLPEMEAEFKRFFPDFNGRFWETDPRVLAAKRARQTEASVTVGSILRRAVEDFARPWDDAARSQGFVPLSDILADSGHVMDDGLLSRLKLQTEVESPRGYMTPTALRNAENMALPREVAEALKRQIEVMRNPQTPGAIMGVLNAATNSFRWLNTRLFPAFYFRNYVSDVWRNFEAGVMSPTHYWDAARVLKDWRFGKGNAAVEMGNGVAMTARQLMDALEASGMRFGILKESALTKAGRASDKLGVSVGENHSRLAHVIGRIRQGDTLEDAVFSAKKYLFDYKELTQLERGVMRNIAPFYCVPEDSEILTRRGWVTCDGLQDGEEVLTYNNEHDCLEWQNCTGKHVYDYDQPIMVFENTRRRLRFTHDHRWPVRIAEATVERPYGTYHYDAKHEIRMGHQLTANCSFICAAPMRSGKSLLTPEQARLLGWIVTDGYSRCRNGNHEAVLYQSPGKFLAEVVEVAGGTPRKPHPQTGVIAVGVPIERLRPLIPHLPKEGLPSVVARLDTKAAEAMYDAMYKAEGTVSKTRRGDHFGQVPGPVLEAFRILATMLGKTTSANYVNGCYVSDRRYLKIGGARLTEEHYVGRVWCPTTPNGTWLMKQGGTIVITGNSWTRFNLPLMLETLVTKPGRLAVVNHAAEALKDGEKGGINTSFVPDWIRRRLFAAVKWPGEDDATVLSGFGLPFEDLALLDGKWEDWLSMLNPVAKFPLERATNKDFFTGRELATQDRANPLLRHVGAVPGGQAFLDWLSFRPTDREGQYRADPWKLHLLFKAPGIAGFSRITRTAEQLAEQPDFTAARFLTGVRSQTFTPEERILQNARRTIEAAQARMREMQAEGVVSELQDKFFVRRDVLPTDPRVLEKRRLDREIRFAQAQIGRIRAAEARAASGVGVRGSGGQ